MDRQAIEEFIRMVLIAFAIAMVINVLRIFVFQNGNFMGELFNTNNENSQIVNDTDYIREEQNNTINSNERYEPRENNAVVNDILDNEVINIPISPLKELSGLSKDEILKIRTEAVKTSPIFSNMNYTPNASVYQIADGRPWISAEASLHWSKCTTDREKTNGVSRDSIGILNPELLYFISLAENEDAENNNFVPLYKDSYFIPYKIEYTPSTKTITTYIKQQKKENGKYQPIVLADSNAHDLGYNFAFMDKSSNIGFYTYEPYKNNRLDMSIKNVTGYYMNGSACGVSGGCNNYAPYWQYYNHFYFYSFPAKFNIKLWKQLPATTDQEADINFEMIFE